MTAASLRLESVIVRGTALFRKDLSRSYKASAFSPLLRCFDIHGSGVQRMENVLLPLQASFAHEFAQEWVEAWNSHDLERILTHYDEEVVLTSPVALKLLGGDGTVRRKAALRGYFLRGI